MLSQLFTLLPLAATVLALPTSSANPAAELTTREGEYIYWKYYGDGGCHGDWIDDSALGQGGNIGVCTPVTPIAGANSFFVEHNDLTRAVRFYTAAGCTGNYVEIPAGTSPNCYAQVVRSVKII